MRMAHNIGLRIVDTRSQDATQGYDKASKSLLQLASSDLLLVHRLVRGVGSSKPYRNLLASSPCVVRGYVPFRDGHWLPRQLA